MKAFSLATVFLAGFLAVAHAQQEADERYLSIYNIVQQAESLSATGDPRRALATLTEAHAELAKFQRIYPDWNPAIVSYRLEDLDKRIADAQARVLAATPLEPQATSNSVVVEPSARPSAAEENLRAQLQSAQAENETLQAKLKEALSSQPPPASADDLAQAHEAIRSLMKENDLLKATIATGRNTNGLSALRRQLSDALDKYAAEHARAEKLVSENTGLQHELQRAGEPDAGAMDLLRTQNDRLKAQLSAMQSAATTALAAGDQAARLKEANGQIAALQTAVSTTARERSALQHQVKQLSAELDQFHAAKYEDRLRELTAERDQLAKELAKEQAAAKKKSGKSSDAQNAALLEEIQVLRARLAVAEAKPAPYAAEELALFCQPAPQPLAPPDQAPTPAPTNTVASTPAAAPAASSASTVHSIHELPGGTAELVISAQRHFSSHEYDAAEADYRKILERDQNNGLALANLATIELQENKLAEAEQHITAAVAQSPNDAYNLSTLGYLRFSQGKYDDALDALSRAAALDPGNPEIQNYLGVTLSHKGLRIQAETALRKAIQLNPRYAPAHNNLAVVYLNQTPPSPLLARWHYQKAIASGQPRNPDLEKLLADKGAPVDIQ